ncbi:MAG: ABC transporter permease [Firmicutes bacterium]|nr:ABC transporter permease [Bacillota bacterium]
MSVLLKIAWRNLKEHRTKTLIIGTLIAVGITVLIVGNSLMDSATAGIERSYIKNFTGHIMISGKHQGNLTLFGFQDLTILEQNIPTLHDYEEIVSFLESLPYVELINPQISGVALASINEVQGAMQLFGIDPESYLQMFPDNIELIRGSFLAKGEEGIVLNNLVAEHMERDLGRLIQPGEKLLLTGVTPTGGMKIREVEVKGIFEFKQSNAQLDLISLVDATNMRALSGMNVGYVSPAKLTEEEQVFLGELDFDSLFSDFGNILVDIEATAESYNEDSLLDIFASSEDTPVQEEEESHSWHFLLVRLTDERMVKRALKELDEFFAVNNIDAEASDWLEAAGVVAEMAYGVKLVFNIIVFLIAIVAVIIIMNTLVISVTERMSEIGTMRAIGAQKTFVRSMILWETLLISGVFGGIGIIAGSLILLVLNITGIKAPNLFFEIIFGGPVLKPGLSLESVVMSFIIVLVVGVVSSLYPTSIVMKTEPVKAMQSQ